jgi:hypothetical protein
MEGQQVGGGGGGGELLKGLTIILCLFSVDHGTLRPGAGPHFDPVL